MFQNMKIIFVMFADILLKVLVGSHVSQELWQIP